MQVIEEYKKLCEGVLAIPVVAGVKTESEKFAGAFYTMTLEALMPDGKALQMATSHNLGQGFAKAFNISFFDEKKQKVVPWQSSWGFSTRLIGAVVMVHGDDKGLVVPPRLAKKKVVVVPIFFAGSKKIVLDKAFELTKRLSSFGAFLDDRENYSPGWKFSDWELKGVPLRVELGPKDIEKNQAVVVRRDNAKKEFVKLEFLERRVGEILLEMQSEMFLRAKSFLDSNIVEAKNEKEFLEGVEKKKLVLVPFCCGVSCERSVKEKHGVSSRCVPLNSKKVSGDCVFCGKKASNFVLFGKSY